MIKNIKELSEKINLSPATISRVVNGKGNVRLETYNRVMAAIKKYNYIPNNAARDLKSKHSSIVGVIIPDLSNEFFTSIVSGVEHYLDDLGYSILLCSYNESYTKQLEHAMTLLSRNIAGLIIAPMGKCKPFCERYSERDIPIVFIDSVPYDVLDCNYVTIDNTAAASMLSNHMLDMYGDDILLLSSHEGDGNDSNPNVVSSIRLASIVQSFEKRGLKPKENWVQISERSTFESGYNIMISFLNAGNKPRGIIATSNNITYGAIAAILDWGLSIPDDIAIACFDAVDSTRLVRPRITSIIQPTKQIGFLAAQLILNKLQASPEMSMTSQKIIVEPSFVIGDSCGYKFRSKIT